MKLNGWKNLIPSNSTANASKNLSDVDVNSGTSNIVHKMVIAFMNKIWLERIDLGILFVGENPRHACTTECW